jgi:hypothetical protein
VNGDSATIDLCLSVFPWAHFRSTKAAVKMHTLLDLRGSIPSFIHISDGKLHDVNVLDLLPPEPGAIYVMDRGYVDFARLYLLHQAGVFFVTRAKSNIDARRIYSAPSDRTNGIICDQIIVRYQQEPARQCVHVTLREERERRYTAHGRDSAQARGVCALRVRLLSTVRHRP